MKLRLSRSHLAAITFLAALSATVACSGTPDGPDPDGNGAGASSPGGGASGAGNSAGSNSPAGSSSDSGNDGGSEASGGTPGTGGNPDAGAGGTSPAGGAGAAAGGSSGGQTGFGGSGGSPAVPALDCGKDGWAFENAGPPKNRVNYLILADGYTATTVDTTLKTHIEVMAKRRFEHESGEPYGRYRKFVNICVMKAVSQNDGIGNGPTIFDGGNGGDRLARVDSTKVNNYIKENVPASFEVDWKAVVLNQDKWENTGSILMLWSGAHADAAGAALHEGGHGHHQLADEYGSQTGCQNQQASCGSSGQAYQEVNSAGNCTTTDNKWAMWLGTTQKGLKVPDMGATGMQGTWQGSRYVASGQYRPSCNSMMNSLFGMNVDTSFNSVSREQMVFGIWRAVVPIDSTEPPEGAVASVPATLKVNVIDPAVINVDWDIDGKVSVNAGTTFSTASLASGAHTITATAYDNATTDLVKLRTSVCPPSVTGNYCHGTAWKRSTQKVTWTFTKP